MQWVPPLTKHSVRGGIAIAGVILGREHAGVRLHNETRKCHKRKELSTGATVRWQERAPM